MGSPKGRNRSSRHSLALPGAKYLEGVEHRAYWNGGRQPLGFWDSALNTGLLWAFPCRQRPEARRRGGSDASDFKRQLQRGQAWRTSPGMRGAGGIVEEPLPRDAGLTPSCGWEAEAKGTLTGWGPASICCLWLQTPFTCAPGPPGSPGLFRPWFSSW